MTKISYTIILTLVILIILMAGFNMAKVETFGMSPGTLVQLSTSHVPTEQDLYEVKAENERVRRDIANMTEGNSYAII